MATAATTLAGPPRRPTIPGLDSARHVTVPEGIVSTGFPAVQATCAELGILFDPWQVGAGRCLLAKAADGLHASDTAVLSIPRQVGKTFFVGGVVFADSIVHPGTTTIWTAHRFKVSRETFNMLRALSLTSKLLPHVDPDDTTTGAGNECITFRNGSRIVFAARERGAIRGFSKVRRLVLDEAQILTDAALSDLAPTQNQAADPQLVFMGTPPKPADPGEVFTRLRQEALDGESGAFYLEFSADPDSDLDDRVAWAKANPSYPLRTPERALMRLRRLLSDEDFAREVLGIWGAARRSGDLDVSRWMALADPDAQRGAPVFGVDVGQDRIAHIGVAWKRPDGAAQVMLADAGLSPLVTASRLVEVRDRWQGPVMLGGPAADLERDLPGATVVTGTEFAAACGRFDDLLRDGRIRHGNQPELNAAVQAARWRKVGTAGERAFQLKDAPTVGPLAAVVRALHGLNVVGPSAYESKNLLIL